MGSGGNTTLLGNTTTLASSGHSSILGLDHTSAATSVHHMPTGYEN
jgi:hypothetical protein